MPSALLRHAERACYFKSEKACFASARESEDLPTLGMWMAARDGRREQVSFWIALGVASPVLRDAR
jgi:hypothetical protein